MRMSDWSSDVCSSDLFDLVQRQFLDAFHHAPLGAWQKTRAQPIGMCAEAEIEACGLDLARLNLARRPDFLFADQRLDAVRGQNAGRMELTGPAPDFQPVMRSDERR